MKILFSAESKADLMQIAVFIAQDNPNRALSFTDELERKCLSLADMPKAFPIVPELFELGIRKRVYQNYSIFFCVQGDQVLVVLVLNSAMDYTALFES